jgi:hypothetical protein
MMFPLETALKPRLTGEFLSLLTEAARTYGWTGDYEEIYRFVEWAYGLAEIEKPTDLEPFEHEDEPTFPATGSGIGA